MALESGTYISDLNPSNPVGATDKVSTLDDHVRLIKSTLQNTFPSITGAVTLTHTELNYLDGITGITGTGKVVLDDAPTIADLTVTGSVTLPAASVADAALSSNVPLKNAANVFTSEGGGANSIAVQVVSAVPYYGWTETDQDANKQRWVAGLFNSVYRFGPVPDSFTGSWSGLTPSIEVRRDEANATLVALASSQEIDLTAPTLDFNGNADISGTLTVGGTITGTGSGLTSLNADNLSSGTVPSDRLPSTIGGNKTFSNNVTVGGTISGNGSGLTNLNADNLSSGTVPSARLPATIGGNKTFSDNVTINGAVLAGTAATSTSSTLAAGQIHHRSANTTVPSMNAGQWVAVQNTGTSPITLSEGSGVTLELGGTTTTGNRTLAAKGFAFIYFRANGIGVVHGSGVS